MTVLVSIDPGGTNGVCRFTDGVLDNQGVVRGMSDLYHWIREQGPDVIVYEEFVGGAARNRRDPLMAIGVIHLVAELLGACLVGQNPSVRVICEEEALAHSRNVHSRSAISHGLYYLRRKK